MKNFKIGCSPVTSKIYAGNVLKNGTWGQVKYDVTETAPIAVAQYLLQLNESIEFTHINGNVYRLQIIKIHDEKLFNKSDESICKRCHSNKVYAGELCFGCNIDIYGVDQNDCR